MTREEAIDILVGVIATNSEEENEALDMAIEALERTPNAFPTHECVKPTHECVSRQRVLDQIELWARYDVPDVEAPMDLVERILELPAAEPKTGRWIDREIPLESGGAMPIQVCNLCSTFYPLAHTGGGYHFCPNCGAKMLEEEVG